MILFGAITNKINMTIFGRRETIGDLAINKLKDLKREFDESEQTIDEAVEVVDRCLGDSIEKHLYPKHVLNSGRD